MTESDWVEMYGMAFSTSISNFASLITLMSGYLVVAYLVGKRLTRTQILVTNALYLMSALIAISGSFQATLDFHIARKEMALQIPQLDLFNYAEQSIYLWPSIIAIINCCLIVASLIFMWQVRHHKES
jgi:TRAP-type C4-dicarboxylate transport system permease small subunit